jgi:NTP pyrophosphatase (non-canonical NTP hydrolase)
MLIHTKGGAIYKHKTFKQNMASLNEISKRHHEWLAEMGWVGKASALEQVAMVASEVAEVAAECEGNEKLQSQLMKIVQDLGKLTNELRGSKPSDKVGSELADIILRTLGIAENLGLDIEKEIENKMQLNAQRGNRGRTK